MFDDSDSERFFRRKLFASARVIHLTYSELSRTPPSDRPSAARWFLDHQWFLQSEFDDVAAAVSKEYCRKLDRAGMTDGEPRVYRVDGSEVALRRETASHLILRPSKPPGKASNL